MAELQFVIQSDQLVAFLGHRVTKCFVSELHTDIAYSWVELYARGKGRMVGVFLDVLSQPNVCSSVKCIYLF